MADYNSPEEIAAREAMRREEAQIERDAALNVAAGEAVSRDIAEAQAVDARIEANNARAAANELATDRNVLHHELAYERAASSNNAFGMTLMVGILVAGLLAAGIYFWWRNSNPDNVVVNAAPAPAPTVVTTPAPPAPAAPTFTPPPVIIERNNPTVVTPPASRPNVNVTVPPPNVHNEIKVQPPATNGGGATTDNSGGSGTGTSGGDTSGGGSSDNGGR